MSTVTRLLLVFCLAIAFTSSQVAGAGELSIYRSLPINGARSEVRLDENSEKLTLGDLTVYLRVCADSDAFECFSSAFLSFAVPKSLQPDTKTWTVGEIEYRLVGYSQEMFLGQVADVFAIAANMNETDVVFYYAKQRGLLGIKGLNTGRTLLLSVDYCGFGAGIDCAEPQ